MKTWIRAKRLISDGFVMENTGVLAEDGVILSILPTPPANAQVLDLQEATLAPALIDLHCHGGAGFEFIDATEEAILGACKIHSDHGTGVLYPTVSAADFDTTWRALEALEKTVSKAPLVIPGVHLEGPYLSPDMCGAQDPGIVRKPDPEEYRAIYNRFGKLIARWDYAPEMDENGEFGDFLQEVGITASTAHSAARYEHMLTALAKGNRLVTHLYSCTSTVTREAGFRKLGVIETAFLKDEIFVEAIGDGCHLPPELLTMIYQIKGAHRICLISDAIRFAGLGDCANAWEGKIPYVIEDGVAKLADRSAFAGSIATADQLLERTVRAGIPLKDVVTMLTATPAKVMGLREYGVIASGARALFSVIGEDLTVTKLSI